MARGMNSKQLLEAVSNDLILREQFVGVFASDQLDKVKIQFPCALIANTDPISKPGTHWVAFFFDPDGNVEYFDSYGLPPQNSDLENFFRKHGVKRHSHNSEILQSILSTVCGHWCLAFLGNRVRGQSMSVFVNRFKNCPSTSNDVFVKKHVSDVYKIKSSAAVLKKKPANRIKTVAGAGTKAQYQYCCCRQ